MRALVLSGGGSKGAFQVGAIMYLMETLKFKYDIYCGVSVGAINAAHLAQYKDGEEKEASISLRLLWQKLYTDKVYKDFPLGKISALWEPSVYNSWPLRKLLEKELDVNKVRESGKQLKIGVVSLDTGNYRRFDENSPELLNAVLASSAFPGMLMPIDIDGELYTDGGVKNITPIFAALSAGATEIDIVMTSPAHVKYKKLDDPNTLDIALRVIELMADEITEGDLREAVLLNDLSSKPKATFRIIRPDKVLTDNSLDFSPIKTGAMLVKGYSKAKLICEGKHGRETA